MKMSLELNEQSEVGTPHSIPYNDEDRKCVECHKLLSGYNKSDRCHCHGVTEETMIASPIRRVNIKKRMDEETKKVKLWMQTY